MTEFEIWRGFYHLGQGYSPPTEPEFLGKIISSDFKTACFKHELKSRLDYIEKLENAGGTPSESDFDWYYFPKTNSNGWLGRYYKSKEEAEKSFK